MIVVLALMFPDVKNLNFYMKWRLQYTSAFSGLHRNIFSKVDGRGSYMELVFQSIILGTAVIKLSTIISDLVSIQQDPTSSNKMQHQLTCDMATTVVKLTYSGYA